MGCCISDDAVNDDLLSCFTCLDVTFGEGKHASWEVICCILFTGAVLKLVVKLLQVE